MICIQRAPAQRLSRVFPAVVVLSLSPALFAQFRGGSDWSTSGNDAQRSSWVRTDPKISPATLAAPGFQLLWKVKLGNDPLSAPVLLDRYIGYRGFRTYAFVGGNAASAAGLDTDLGRIEWQKKFEAKVAAGSASCPGGSVALARPASSALPSTTAGRFGGMGGRGGPAKSGVGDPLEGAVTLAQVAANRPPSPPPTAPAANQPAPPAPAPRGFGPRPTFLYALSSDGAFHTMYVSNGEESEPPIPFLPPNANVSDFSVVDGVAYAATTNKCGPASDGLWALDLATKTAVNWQGAMTGGEAAFGPSGAYLTAAGKLLALDQKTLAVAASYDAGQPFSTAPLLFDYKTKVLAAAAAKDGTLYLVDSASPTVAAAKSPAGDPDPYALASWQTTAETRWIIATSASSITAWKIADRNGNLALQQAWTSHDVQSPAAPLVINGVLFALQRGDRSHNSVLYALDATTGKKLWTSGDTVSSFVPKSGGLAAGGSSIYFGTHDGTLWAFGFPIEH
jgi:hypothetical protein